MIGWCVWEKWYFHHFLEVEEDNSGREAAIFQSYNRHHIFNNDAGYILLKERVLVLLRPVEGGGIKLLK